MFESIVGVYLLQRTHLLVFKNFFLCQGGLRKDKKTIFDVNTGRIYMYRCVKKH